MKRELTTDPTMNANNTELFWSGGENRDPNSNPEVGMDKIAKKITEYDEFEKDAALPAQGIPPAVASDHLMRQAHTMPAAGSTVPRTQLFDQLPSSRHYKMASDIFGTGMDKSWTDPAESVQSTPKNVQQNPITGSQMTNRGVLGSFKITEMSSNGMAIVEDPAGNPAFKRARESSGNPLTGQGFNPEYAKTGKRYFEGSNANQKLW